MQKNKFVYEDIKAVCNSATKKLVALGLLFSIGVGGAVTGNNKYCHTVSAQGAIQNESELHKTWMLFLSALTLADLAPQDFENQIKSVLDGCGEENKDSCQKIIDEFFKYCDHNGENVTADAIRIFADLIPFIETNEVALITQPYTSAAEFIEQFLEAGANDRRRYLMGRFPHLGLSSFVPQVEKVFGRLERGYQLLSEQARLTPDVVNRDDFIMELFNLRSTYVREGMVFLNLEGSETQRMDGWSRERELINQHNALVQELSQARREISRLNNIIQTNRRGTVSGTQQMIQARENQHIEAGPSTHVHSFSDNELIHEGAGHATITGTGGVDIDVGDITLTVSECDEDLSRNVTVNQANSLTVAPGISMRTRNGTKFTMGETLQETAENILRALSPNSLLNIINRFGSSGGSK